MAEIPEDPTQRQNTGLPLPPPFYKDFTPDNLLRYQAILSSYLSSQSRPSQPSAAASTSTSQTQLKTTVPPPPPCIPLTDLPPELVTLQPPSPPEDGEWRCFGDRYTLKDELPTLEEQQIERLIPEGTFSDGLDEKQLEREVVLKRCAKSLLLNYLEMASLMRKDPWAGHVKSLSIRTIFINLHHALNEYRPHQARESLIQLMQEQLDRKRAETQANREAADKAKRVLEGLGSLTVPGNDALFPGLYGGVDGAYRTEGSLREEGGEGRDVRGEGGELGDWERGREWHVWRAVDEVLGNGNVNGGIGLGLSL
ncbi:putative mediator of RNA polymerase ii transcription subunit 7 protein [Zalerion maritima]|uniref:Mediator of RNA polymerase II transcription subunit 7 n=1 Tax=Zalerion maritima TaxID=339359 RepID=A0AAD5RKK3_9PEZI|nr:putative mediator of RNA polymerase ii transcription subunit 7 protein [Zalerion maritima]